MGLVNTSGSDKDRAIIFTMIEQLDRIYSNKSGDEYKMHGDITASPMYDLIQRTVADLSLIKGLNKTDIGDLKRMFDMLHRPNFKKIVTEYMANKASSAIVTTAIFTCAYRVLIGELSTIYTSTEATKTGFVFKPTKYTTQNRMTKFIKGFNTRIDSELEKVVRSSTKGVNAGKSFRMESYIQEADDDTTAEKVFKFINDKLGPVGKIFKEIGAWCRLLFPNISALNPISWMSSILSDRYDDKVDKYEYAAKLYFETKNAYDEYMKQPEFKRSKKVEANYLRNIDKYNIKMQNTQAAIAHYDQRAIKETIEANRREEEYLKKKQREEDSKKTTSSTKSDTKGEDTSSTDNDDPFDF